VRRHVVNQIRTTTERLSLPPLAAWPMCSIIIPCLGEEDYIEAAVRAAMAQRYPESKLEIIVADGGSKDRTRAIVAALAAGDPRVVLVDNPGRFPSAGMNVGIRHARGEVIVRMDAHAEYASDYVSASVDALRRTGAANVGGAARARHRGPFQHAVCAALSSPLGVGGSAYRDPSREGFVESVFNGSFRREIFDHVGLYDERARTNEDAELNQRIIEAGGAIYLSREVVAFYYPRSSLRGVMQQYFSYGQGRARTLLKRRRLLSVRPLVPFGMVTAFALGFALSALLPALAPLVALGVGLYATLVVAESVRVARREGLSCFPGLLLIFPVMHVAHGIGVWDGLFRNAGVRFEHLTLERRLAR
jgi:succinoglycan biosynthesis protein ExoA